MSKKIQNKILNKKRERAKEEDEKINELEENNNLNDFNFEFISNPSKLIFYKNIIQDRWTKQDGYKNKFLIFNSIYNFSCLIYTNSSCSIICYNINENKKINEIKKAHKYNILDFQHYLDKKNKRDLILSISSWIYDIKLWVINKLECIYIFKQSNYKDLGDELFEFYSDAFVYTACFLYNMDNYYIVIGKFFIFVTDNKFPIEVFDFNGNFVKRINDSNEGTEKIICYYDELTSKQFIISIYGNSLKSFYFDENKVYHKYSENNNNKNINDDNSENSDNNIDNEINLIIYKEDKIIKLIGLNNEGILRIWNFHSAELLKKLDIIRIYSICLWNNKYLFIGSEDYPLF